MLICLGAAITAGFFIRRHVDRQNQLALMSAFEERIASQKNDTIEDHSYDGQVVNRSEVFSSGDTMAILSIERLGIKVAVTEGTSKDKLRVSAGHFEDSDLPGEGNFAIAGHSSLIYTCLFNKMHEAVIGDVIKVATKSGNHEYTVCSIDTVEPKDIGVIEHVNESIITIVTCVNDGNQRLIVRGIET